MIDDLADFYVHTIGVETRTGQDENGADVFTPLQLATGWLEDATSIVRSTTGDETVSSARFYCPAATAALFTPDSRVTLASRAAQVITVNVNDSGPLGLPDHAVISLT